MSTRLQKVNTMLVKRFAEILQSEVEFSRDVLVTVTRAEVSVDLRYATIYISVLPAHKAPSTLARLERHLPHLQHVLHKGLTLRRRPQLRVAIDKGEQHASRIEQVLAQEKRFGPRHHGHSDTRYNPDEQTDSQTRG